MKIVASILRYHGDEHQIGFAMHLYFWIRNQQLVLKASSPTETHVSRALLSPGKRFRKLLISGLSPNMQTAHQYVIQGDIARRNEVSY